VSIGNTNHLDAGTETLDEMAEGLIADLIERSMEHEPTGCDAESHVAGLVMARIVGFQGTSPQLLMEINGEHHYAAAVAVTGILDPVTDSGASVCVSFERNDIRRPIVLGKIVSGLPEAASSRSEGVEISNDREIVLRCGKASISLKADGTVAIRGTNVASRASHTNRIRGGNVQIN